MDLNKPTVFLFLPTEAIAELSSNPTHNSQRSNILTSFPVSDFLSFSFDIWDKSFVQRLMPDTEDVESSATYTGSRVSWTKLILKHTRKHTLRI